MSGIPNLTVMNITPDGGIYNSRPAGCKIAAIVLHHTGGVDSRAQLSKYHSNPVSVHKLVPKRMPDGKPGHYQIVPDNLRAWHAGASTWGGRDDWNDFSIGVEIENLGNGHDPYTDEQYETVSQIIAYQGALYGIGRGWVRLHREISGRLEGKTDPDPTFSVARVWARVDEIEAVWPYGIPRHYGWHVEPS